MALFKKIVRLLKPLDGDGDDTGSGSGEDRGDSWTPTDDTVTDVEAKNPPADKKPAPTKEVEDEVKADADKNKPNGDDNPDDADKDAAGKDKDKPPRADTRIPVARHKEILDKERARSEDLAKKLEAYEKGKAVTVTNEKIKELDEKLIGLEEEYNDLMSEGKVAEAKAKWRELRTVEREGNDMRVRVATEMSRAQAIEQVRYDNAIDRIEEAYPQLKEGSEEFDAELSADVVRMARAYQTEGFTPTDSIQKAVKRLCGAAETKKQKDAVDVKPKVDETEVEKVERQRKAEAARKAAEAMGKQPPRTDKVGSDSDKAGGTITARDAIKLPFDEFKGLSERELARMRGDEL